MVAFQHGGRLHSGDIGASVWLGQTIARDFRAGRLWHEILLLLRFRAPLKQRHRVETGVNADDHAQGRVNALQFFADHRQTQVIEARAAVFLRQTHAQKSQFTHPFDDWNHMLGGASVGACAFTIPFLNKRGDFFFGEIAHGLAQHGVGFVEKKSVVGCPVNHIGLYLVLAIKTRRSIASGQ